jgi:hypothetical protein
MSEPETFDPERAGVSTCEWCGGDFLPEDMDGEHCRECAHEIFEGEA